MLSTVECLRCGKDNPVGHIYCIQEVLVFHAFCDCELTESLKIRNYGAALWCMPRHQRISKAIIELLLQVNYTLYDFTKEGHKAGTYGLNLIGKFYNDISDENPNMTLESLQAAINEWKATKDN